MIGDRIKLRVLVFFAAFAAYLWTMPPTLPAYRDAGEMATSAYTLGVSHPPSYPLYIIAGHAIIDALPFGDPAYRLTLLSALASAAALAVMFAFLSLRLGFWPAAGAAVLLGMNTTYWSVAVVPEMYSLMLLFALILWALAWKLRDGYQPRLWAAFVFLYGLFLGNRTDLLLWAPGLFWLALSAADAPIHRETKLGRWMFWTAIFGVAGLSVYLYLPLRSAEGPWLDWNHPATWTNFIGSLTRRGYGGTLDMLSKSYEPGSQFAANLRVYALHLWKDYLGAGIVVVLAGVIAQFRRDRRVSIACLFCYAASGPLFLFLANMPPNPHALAIVEPHYLLSDLVLALWTAEGLAALGIIGARTLESGTASGVARAGSSLSKRFDASIPIETYPLYSRFPSEFDLTSSSSHESEVDRSLPILSGDSAPPRTPVAVSMLFPMLVTLVLAVSPWTIGRGFNEPGGVWWRVNRRWELHNYDYAGNMFRSLPSDSVLVAKKDVQLFSLWYFQTVRGARPDVHIVAQGLSASPWYQNARRRMGETAFVGPLRSADDWRKWAALNGGRAAFATPDAEFPGELRLGPPRGLAIDISTGAPADETPWPFLVRRGDYHYEGQPDFFLSDLVEAYADAHQRLGAHYSQIQRFQESLNQVRLGWTMKWVSPEAAVFSGFDLFSLGRAAEAAGAYRLAILLFNKTLDLAAAYHSLPALANSLRRSEAEVQVNLGVLLEKSGDKAGAEKLYRDAIALAPDFDQAHYDLAVLYWGRDWELVVREMSEAARLNPNNPNAARYLQQARQRLGK